MVCRSKRLTKAENILIRYHYKLTKIPKKTRDRLDDLVTKQELRDLMSFKPKTRRKKR